MMPQSYCHPFAVGVLLLALAAPSGAGMCDLNENPAATLLLPYFEVDRDNPEAGNTIFTINNALPQPALAHITFWTDWSHPTVNFDVFLTGYDIVSVNLADVFVRGDVPITADEPSDLEDEISPHGGFRSDGGFVGEPHPEWDGSFTDCQNFFPFYVNPVIYSDNFGRLVDGHTGRPHDEIGGGCLGADFEDNIARGYVTIDNVNRCSVEFPSDHEEGYFADDGSGTASNVNQLWGDWIYLDRENGFAHGDSLVHLEALDGFDARGDGTSDPQVPDPETGATFYGRYTTDGEDNREPLGVTWGVRYINNATFEPGGTEFMVWRDPIVDPSGDGLGYECGHAGDLDVGPDWHPLDETLVLAFDDFENVVDLCSPMGCPVCSPPFTINPRCFPLSTQRTSHYLVGLLGSPWGAGWMYMDLRLPTAPPDPSAGHSQSFVSATHSAQGLFSIGLPAIELSSACAAFDETQTPDHMISFPF